MDTLVFERVKRVEKGKFSTRRADTEVGPYRSENIVGADVSVRLFAKPKAGKLE